MNIIPELDNLPAWIPWYGRDATGSNSANLSDVDLPNGIDLGNGQLVDASDVVDGHFQRLSTNEEAVSRLNVSIAALAPDITPLTALAEDVAKSAPDAQPADQFRTNLHQALEAAHQQQAAQRVLGIQPHFVNDRPILWRIITKPAMLAGVPVLVCVMLFVWRRRMN